MKESYLNFLGKQTEERKRKIKAQKKVNSMLNTIQQEYKRCKSQPNNARIHSNCAIKPNTQKRKPITRMRRSHSKFNSGSGMLRRKMLTLDNTAYADIDRRSNSRSKSSNKRSRESLRSNIDNQINLMINHPSNKSSLYKRRISPATIKSSPSIFPK